MDTWDELEYFSTGEWQVVDERLDDLDKLKTKYTPTRKNIFRIFDLIKPKDIKVVILGQDPYPSVFNTGIAFGIPKGLLEIPLTLSNILREYEDDLHYGLPLDTVDVSLEKWVEEGVFLWNAMPIRVQGRSVRWSEFELLTREIITRLSQRDLVFVFLGSYAKSFEKYIAPWSNSRTLFFAHPSPVVPKKVHHPFLGSRMFSTINQELTEVNKDPIDWRL